MTTEVSKPAISEKIKKSFSYDFRNREWIAVLGSGFDPGSDLRYEPANSSALVLTYTNNGKLKESSFMICYEDGVSPPLGLKTLIISKDFLSQNPENMGWNITEGLFFKSQQPFQIVDSETIENDGALYRIYGTDHPNVLAFEREVLLGRYPEFHGKDILKFTFPTLIDTDELVTAVNPKSEPLPPIKVILNKWRPFIKKLKYDYKSMAQRRLPDFLNIDSEQATAIIATTYEAYP